MGDSKRIKQTPTPSGQDASLLIGAHVSTNGGLPTAFDRATQLGINTFQLFVKNNKQWFGGELSSDDIAAFKAARAKWGASGPLVAHAAYLLNLGSPKPDILERSRASYLAEFQRADALGVEYLVFHPGAHTGCGDEESIRLVAESLNHVHAETSGAKTLSVIEITAGQGTSVGCSFLHLRKIIDQVQDSSRVAICLDTCHMFAAGYDIRTPETWARTFDEFQSTIGFDKLVCVHTNDSKKGLNSRVDRHEQLGKGEIGTEAFHLLMTDLRFAKIPKILETPKDDKMTEDFVNLALLRSLASS